MAECRLCVSHPPSSINCGCDEGCDDARTLRVLHALAYAQYDTTDRAGFNTQLQRFRGCSSCATRKQAA